MLCQSIFGSVCQYIENNKASGRKKNNKIGFSETIWKKKATLKIGIFKQQKNIIKS